MVCRTADGMNSSLCRADRPASETSRIDIEIDDLKAAYAREIEICDLLEAIADALPERPHRFVIEKIIAALENGDAPGRAQQEQHVLSRLECFQRDDHLISNIFEVLRIETQRDVDRTYELLNALDCVVQIGDIGNADSFGYLLRSYFEGKRRHIHLKTAVLVPLAKRLSLRSPAQSPRN